MQTITLIDTFGFLFRSYFALPPLKNKDGFPTGLLMGFANLLINLHKDRKGGYLVFALEGRDNKRKAFFSDYKSTRQDIPEDLALQLPIALGWIKKMGFVSVEVEGYEADDVIASLSNTAVSQGLNVEILSHDKDLYQLISDKVSLFDPIKKIPIKKEGCFHKFGVYPENFIDYQSLIGDSIDNVPGINGIGAKTAQKLIAHFKTLDSIYENTSKLQEVVSARIAQKVIEGKEMAYLSKELVSLKRDLLPDFDFTSTQIPEQNPLEKIVDDLEKYEFHKLLQRVKKLPLTISMDKIRAKGIGGIGYIPPDKSKFSYTPHLITKASELFEILDSIPKDKLIAYDSESNMLDAVNAKMVGFSFCFDGINGYYVPVNHGYLSVGEQISNEDAKRAIEQIFTHPIIGHNLKYDLIIANQNYHITPPKTILDTMLLAWLLDSAALVGLDILMERLFMHKMITFDAVVEKDSNFGDVDLKRASEYASEDAVATHALYHKLCEIYEEKGLESVQRLGKELEYPLIKVLMNMECEGIKIDVNWFEALNLELKTKISEKEKEIFAAANQSFNINSPKQLSEVLFGSLGLRGVRQIKGGYSTDEQTLEEIYNDHPIIPLILEYREYSKLKNTYVEPMLKLRSNEDRIHTSFLQTGTTTGRLSSRMPNLQNIPVRTESGRQIRRGFISSPGKKLLSIDYSQIELRLLAHFSEDPELLSAFREDVDIHLRTAQMLFDKEDAPNKRHIAKTINFGLIYGMGSRKLAKTLKIKTTEAKEYIDRYFDSFPTVKNFLSIKENEIIERGYAETLFGHRRYFKFQGISEFMKGNFLREGINAIFQGSAADLIKLSMIKINEHFKDDSDVKMLLQVHDELIFEVAKSKCQDVAKIIEGIMCNVYELRIPLKCNIAIGDNWAELK